MFMFFDRETTIMSWTDERVDLLKSLWGEGKTAAEIAKELGAVTRNAVIGKAHRLKLSNRVSPIQQSQKKATPVKLPAEAKAGAAQKEKEKEIIAASTGKKGGVSMVELKERMCKWPIGDPRESGFYFCGGEGVPGLPYCPDHAKIAYQAASRNRILKAKDFEDTGKDKPRDDDLQDAVA